MHTFEGMEAQLLSFLTSILDGGEWPALCPGRFAPGEKIVPFDTELGGPRSLSDRRYV
jgi:hypothetical protein